MLYVIERREKCTMVLFDKPAGKCLKKRMRELGFSGYNGMRRWFGPKDCDLLDTVLQRFEKASLPARDTLCWDCKKACGGCCWSAKLIPVKGWQAMETQKAEYSSYLVMACPEFVHE